MPAHLPQERRRGTGDGIHDGRVTMPWVRHRTDKIGAVVYGLMSYHLSQ